jgi:hypothetical protein
MTARIARLCAHLDRDNFEDFEQRAARYGAAAALARIITAMQTGTDPILLTPDLDALDEAFARHGIDNLTGTLRAYRPLPGTGEHPVIRAWVCPANRPCPRLIPRSGTTPPVCALTRQALTLIEV